MRCSLLSTLVLIVMATVFGRPAIASETTLRAVGAQGHGWVILPLRDGYSVYHHAPGDSWLEARRTDGEMLTLPERVACSTLVDGAGRLTIVFPPTDQSGERAVRQKLAVLDPVSDRWIWQPMGRFSIRASLPGDSRLAGLVATDDAVYALIRGRAAGVLRSPESADRESSGGEDEEDDERRPIVGPATRLLRLDADVWQQIPLPEALNPKSDDTWHLFRTSTGLGILAGDPADAARSILHERQGDGTWLGRTVAVTIDEVHTAVATLDTIVLALRDPEASPDEMGSEGEMELPGAERLRLVMMRGDHLIPIAAVDVPAAGSVVLASGPDVIVLTTRGEMPPVVAVYELMTGRLRESGALHEPALLTSRSVQPLLFVAALLMATIVVIVFKPDPAAQAVTLPQGAAPADILGRALALLIDLVPALAVTLPVIGVSPTEAIVALKDVLLLSMTLESLPVVSMILGITIMHSTATEVIWGRSLGKAVVGYRVVAISGEAATPGQVVTRNGLKLIICLVPVIALLALWSPYRQHLGDTAARTVVVRQRPDEESRPSE
ncbi:MAG: RDD family protein [Phycisphaerales bacterium]|nr:RDD family protein [Phycisphaerales bacterium]